MYPYIRWSESTIPNFERGERVQLTRFELLSGTTDAPALLSEVELITIMDKTGIGTDATIAQHIKTIQDRKYVVKHPNGLFEPTELGTALVEGYECMGFHMAKPYLRAEVRRHFSIPNSSVHFF